MNVVKTGKIGERAALLIIALLGIVDGLITVASLTLLNTEFRANFLFSDLCDRISGTPK